MICPRCSLMDRLAEDDLPFGEYAKGYKAALKQPCLCEISRPVSRREEWKEVARFICWLVVFCILGWELLVLARVIF